MIEWLADDNGILLRRDVIASGCEDKDIARAVRGGRLIRLRQGAYSLRNVWEQADPGGRHRLLSTAVRQQYGDGVALSHTSGHLEYAGPDWGLDLTSAHLTHLDGVGGRRAAKVIHHHGVCIADDITRDDVGWRTAPTRTALDTASLAPRDPAVAVLDWYLNQGLTTPELLQQTFERMTSWPNTLALQIVLRLADGLAESVAETRARLLFMDQRIPRPVSQFEVFRPDGRLGGRVDFAWPERRTLLEVDGAVKYHRLRRPGESIEEMVMREKAREDLLRELTGWTLIRLIWADLARPRTTAERILRAFQMAA
ncbi:hypothetical protein ASE01_18760 [Nocardioides sp. Root190]|uniref:type IV toxin-antitoxin system AbiEi family antitoxin domain-containing protein n=1 Tax=Nocardioides sp. Root190 TaxID=1736488 RepID=UPI000701F1F2|nr:type IV toxin-antitoxin system AbiEi family antitoxin domain-containing protein [Nocardioides sp. Root190]KRB74037.1 hypothetical protein ASE01_18760 [Nocardioides sp. Root190]